MGEPAANPYLYMAANIAAGLDGIRRERGARRRRSRPTRTPREAPMLPTSLADAVARAGQGQFYREAFGDTLVDYLLQMKRAELARYEAAVGREPAAPRGRTSATGRCASTSSSSSTQEYGAHRGPAAHRPVQLPARAQRGRGGARCARWWRPGPSEIGLMTKCRFGTDLTGARTRGYA